jgi:hypothetical protein
MKTTPFDKYLAMMSVLRSRFDMIDLLRLSASDRFLVAETSAFHGRKIIEGIAFGCLIAVEHGIGDVPRDARGQWNADSILQSLQKKKLGSAFPSPSIIRKSTADEERTHRSYTTIDGQLDRRLTLDELRDAYNTLHGWNHEINPYVNEDRQEFLDKNETKLWNTLGRLHKFIERHTISIRGRMFFAVLKDSVDGQVKVLDLTKVQGL